MTGKRVSRRSFLGVSAGAVAAGVSAPAPLWAAATKPRTLRDRVAQLFVISFRGSTLSPETVTLLQRYAFGGVILYADNCVTGTQLRSLTSALQSVSRFPLLIGVDQEGGPVVRITKGAPVFPAEAAYGRLGSVARVYADAATTAHAIRALGLTMNLAPVVDVLSNPKSPIGQRSYGNNATLAARLSVSAIQGYQQHGLAATAKHFIGLGNTGIDTHHARPTVSKTWQQFEQSDLIPFRAAIKAGVSAMLVAHVVLPKIDPVARPASLSPVIIKSMIRGKLGFKGVVMTDSLMMGAVPQGREVSAAERALVAGADILLLASDRPTPFTVFTDAVDRIVSSVHAGRIPESWIDAALARIGTLKRRYPATHAAAR